jgi:hypothetical protein
MPPAGKTAPVATGIVLAPVPRRAVASSGMKLLSFNVGRPRPNPWKGLSATGIDKRPVDGPGVGVTVPGLKGEGKSAWPATGPTT